MREKLPDIRNGLTKRCMTCGFKYYVTVNFFEDKRPAEIFVAIAKEGSAVSGFIDSWCIAISLAWQFGVPWEVLATKFIHQKFEPSDDANPSLVHAITETTTQLITEYGKLNEPGF